MHAIVTVGPAYRYLLVMAARLSLESLQWVINHEESRAECFVTWIKAVLEHMVH